MALCYIVSRAIVLQGGWPLFYIEWGWCWWTIIILILKTLWLLACSFLHCWHSFLRLSDNVLRHRKTTPELWRAKEWWFYEFPIYFEVNPPCGRLFSFCVLNITYLAAGFKTIREIHDLLWGAASDLSRWIALLVPIGECAHIRQKRLTAYEPDIVIHSLPKMNRLQNRL